LSLTLALGALALAACSGGGNGDLGAVHSTSPLATASTGASASAAPSASTHAAVQPSTAAPTHAVTSAAASPRTTASSHPTAVKTSASPASTGPVACPNNSSSTSLAMNNDPTASPYPYTFAPKSVSVACGGTVKVTNNTVVDHNVTPTHGGFTATDVPPAMTASMRFSFRGSYGFECTLHPTMTGAVNVT